MPVPTMLLMQEMTSSSCGVAFRIMRGSVPLLRGSVPLLRGSVPPPPLYPLLRKASGG